MDELGVIDLSELAIIAFPLRGRCLRSRRMRCPHYGKQFSNRRKMIFLA
jgi:hypothetical protein